jgi:hypothetical protein
MNSFGTITTTIIVNGTVNQTNALQKHRKLISSKILSSLVVWISTSVIDEMESS